MTHSDMMISRRAHRPRMTDGGRAAGIVEARDGARHVRLAASGDAQPDDVDQQIFAFAAHRRGQPRRIERGDLARQMLGDRDTGKIHVRGQMSEVRGQRSDVRDQMLEVSDL